MVYILVDSNGNALNNTGEFGALQMAQVFPPALMAEKLHEFPHSYAVRLDVRAPRPRPRPLPVVSRRSEAGFAGLFLIEFLVVSIVMLTLCAMSIPSLTQMRFNQQQSDAKDRVRLVGNAEATAAVCAATQG